MYDSGKVIIGLVIFVAIATFPFWFGMGKAAPMPEPQLPKGKKECVESKEFMRSTHMQLLNEWRDQALRDGDRTYVNHEGKKIWISLQNTCMKCHDNKEVFCDKCHIYANVKPYCWDCHFIPKESKQWN